MQIVINTEQPLSGADRAALLGLLGISQAQAAYGADAAFDSNVEAGTVTPIKKAPAKKTAAKKAFDPKALEPKIVPEGDEEASPDRLAERAANMVRALLSSGKRDDVKKALDELEITKVSDLADDAHRLYLLIVALGKIK